MHTLASAVLYLSQVKGAPELCMAVVTAVAQHLSYWRDLESDLLSPDPDGFDRIATGLRQQIKDGIIKVAPRAAGSSLLQPHLRAFALESWYQADNIGAAKNCDGALCSLKPSFAHTAQLHGACGLSDGLCNGCGSVHRPARARPVQAS